MLKFRLALILLGSFCIGNTLEPFFLNSLVNSIGVGAICLNWDIAQYFFNRKIQ